MKTIFLPGVVLALSLNVCGQQLPDGYRLTRDTIQLKEITCAHTIPLNNGQIGKFYRTNYFSTIDNLTGRLDGISLIKRGAYAMEPQMNGFSGGQLNITIDGMKMFGACTDKMDPITSYIEPVNLKGITLEHGTNCSLYGNNIGGSMDMALQDPECGGIHPVRTSLAFGYESVSNGRNVLLSTGTSGRNWAWILNAVYRKNDLYRDGHGEKINFSQFGKFNVHSALKFIPGKNSSLKADLLWDLAENVGYPALPMDVKRARAVLSSVGYQLNKPEYNVRARIYYNSVYHLMDDSKRDSLYILKIPSAGRDSVIMRMDMPGWSDTFGSYALAEINLNSKNRLTVKTDNYLNYSLAEMTMHMHFKGEPQEPPMYLQTWPDLIRNVTGLYIGNTTSFTPHFLVAFNGRLDYNFDRFRSTVAKEQFSVLNINLKEKYGRFTKGLNLSAQYRISMPLLLSFQTGWSERMPTVSERFGFYLFNAYDGYDYIGNPVLRPEKSVSARFGITYSNHGLKINFWQSFNLLSDYILGITNHVIPPMNFYTNGLRVYQNLPHARLYSSDFQMMYKSLNGLSFFMLTKYTRGELNAGTPLPLIPPLKNFLVVSYESEKWSIQAENETAFRQDRINAGYGERKSPSYTVFNVKANYNVTLREAMLDFSAGITNLFNVYYYEHLDWGHIPRPGRSFNFFIRYTFGPMKPI